MFFPTKNRTDGAREKLCSSKGMTLTELLVALMIVGLIGVSLTVGVNGAVNVYRDATRLYEAETLCGTILTCLEDEFRFARNIQTGAGETVTAFDSQVFGSGVNVEVDTDGKVLIGGSKLLSDAAYTSGLRVLEDKDSEDRYDISYDTSTKQVTIKITVGSDVTNTAVAHTVKVVPLGA